MRRDSEYTANCFLGEEKPLWTQPTRTQRPRKVSLVRRILNLITWSK